MNNKELGVLNSILDLAGTVFRMKHPGGLNLSIYFVGTRLEEPGLIKIEELAYRGDRNLPDRSDKVFFSLKNDEAVILDSVKQKVAVWREIDQSQFRRPLVWVYAIPIIVNEMVIGVICFSGSSAADYRDVVFRKDVEELGASLRECLYRVNEVLDIPSSWKEAFTLNN